MSSFACGTTAGGADELTRRRFVLSMLSGLVVLGAGGCATLAAPTPPTTSTRVPTTVRPDDIATMTFAASLEILAVGTYATVPGAVAADGLGPIPPALQELLAIAGGHHRVYRDAWNEKLTERGRPAVTDPDPTFKTIVQRNLSRAGSVAEVGGVLASVEGVLAANGLTGVSQFQDAGLQQLSAAVHMEVMQHAAVLKFLLSGNPVPDAFASDEFSLR